MDVLPGYGVDLHADLGAVVLPAGSYTLEARVRAAGMLLRERTRVTLFAPNELATRRVRLVSFEPPRVVDGEDATLSAAYRNTGNVPFEPKAELLVSGRQGPISLHSERVSPGSEGKATGTLCLGGKGPRELTVRLLVGGHLIGTRTVSVTRGPPRERPAPCQRLERGARGVVVLVLAVLLVVALVALVRLAAATR